MPYVFLLHRNFATAALITLISAGAARAADPTTTSSPIRVLCGSISWNDPTATSTNVSDVEVAIETSNNEPIAVVNATDIGALPEPCHSQIRPPAIPTSLAGQGVRTGYFGFISQRVTEANAAVVTFTVPAHSQVQIRCQYQKRALPCATVSGLTTVSVPTGQQIDLYGRYQPSPVQSSAAETIAATPAPAAPLEAPNATPSPAPTVAPPGPIAYVTDRKPDATPPVAPAFFENDRPQTTIQNCAVRTTSAFYGDLCYMSYGEVNLDNTVWSVNSAPSDAAKVLHDRILTDYPGTNEVVLLITGFNHSFSSSIEDARALSAALDAATVNRPVIPVIVYSWPTKAADFSGLGVAPRYPDDETNNTWSALHLRQFLGAFLDADPNRPLKVDIMAHSMGNRLLLDVLLILRSETLAQDGYRTPCTESTQPGHYCKRIGNVITIEPDVDEQTYAEQAEELADFVNGITLYGSTIDHALEFSQKLHWHCRAGELNCGDAYFAPTLTVIDATNLRRCDPIFHHSYWPVSSIILSDLAELIASSNATVSGAPRPHLQYTEAPLIPGSQTPFPHYEVNQTDAEQDCR